MPDVIGYKSRNRGYAIVSTSTFVSVTESSSNAFHGLGNPIGPRKHIHEIRSTNPAPFHHKVVIYLQEWVLYLTVGSTQVGSHGTALLDPSLCPAAVAL